MVDQPQASGRAGLDGGGIRLPAGAGGCVGLGLVGGDSQREGAGCKIARECVLAVKEEVVGQRLDACFVGIPGSAGGEIMRQELEDICK